MKAIDFIKEEYQGDELNKIIGYINDLPMLEVNPECRNLSEAIDSFDWIETDEGFDYWNCAYDEAVDKETKD